MKYDNAAGRLLAILERAKEFDREVPAGRVWQVIFDLPSQAQNALMAARYAKAMSLPDEVLRDLSEDHPELVESPPTWVGSVTTAFMQHTLHNQIGTFVDHYSTGNLNDLRTVAVLLNKGSKRKIIPQDQLVELRNQLNSLIDEIFACDQDEGFKLYLIRSIRKIIIALDEYAITGGAPILEAIEQTVGHAFVDKSYREILKDTDIGRRTLDVLSAASNLVTVAIGLPQLAFTASILLQGAGVT